jgi:hypothetical protein
VDIQNLTAEISKEITALKSSVAYLQILFNSQNKGGNISRDAANHSTATVDILKERVMNTANEFNEVLTARKKVRFMSSILLISVHSFMQLRHSRIYTIICRALGYIKTRKNFRRQLQPMDQISIYERCIKRRPHSVPRHTLFSAVASAGRMAQIWQVSVILKKNL